MTKTNNPKVIKSKNQNYSSSIQEWVEMGQVWKEHLEEIEYLCDYIIYNQAGTPE
jgi:hypothetical protein